ncbi:MAG TPA: hypothetical protein VG056_02320 [Pirellulales bacterium]|jgi:hypothetical protein|nr:hypothetical protein [Pirellulales bacterium]
MVSNSADTDHPVPVKGRNGRCFQFGLRSRKARALATPFCLCAAFIGLLARESLPAELQSRWVRLDSSGKLVYEVLPSGDRIMDFSSAGYMGGGVRIPSPPVSKIVRPSGGDDTAAIQEAIDAVSRQSLVGGFRGAVLLEQGAFRCKATLAIRASGVVLRGSGSGPNVTTIEMTGSPHGCISIAGPRSASAVGNPVTITDAYVPSGTNSFHVRDAAQFHAGDSVIISRPITRSLIEFMGMDKLVRDGQRETWLAAGSEILTERTIQSISGDLIALDIPLTDSLDANYLNPPGATVAKRDAADRISQVGVENLRIVSPPQPVTIGQPHHSGIRLSNATDCWVRDVAIRDTVGSVSLGSATSRITVERVDVAHSVATLGGPKPADFSADGTQILIDNCSATGDNLFYFVTGARVTGPIVLLNCTFHGNGHVEPHQRWATGLLVDNCHVPEGGIDFMNRGEMGSGHGWTMGWAVAWNCSAKSFVIQQPPGAANWAIGCQGAREAAPMPFGNGPKLPEGIYDSHGTRVAPTSLYLEQLTERLASEAQRKTGH